jgi:hypothetical protein
MVSQGLALYYQALLHHVHDDTPSFFEHVMESARRQRHPAMREGFTVESAQ